MKNFLLRWRLLAANLKVFLVEIRIAGTEKVRHEAQIDVLRASILKQELETESQTLREEAARLRWQCADRGMKFRLSA